MALLEVTITLTNDQIKALPTTPVEILPAPTAGTIAFPVSMLVITHFSDGKYTNINTDGYLEVKTGTTSITEYVPNESATGLNKLGQFLSGNTLYQLKPQAQPLNGWDSAPGRWTVSSVKNGATTIDIDNGDSGDLTGGHANNTMKIILTYQEAVVGY